MKLTRLRLRTSVVRERLSKARNIVIEKVINRTKTDPETIDLVNAYSESSRLLGDYVTLDWPHHEAIRKVLFEIKKYATDRTRKRPLNIIMQAEPGSGKSHLVKCLAESIIGVDAVAIDYNMACLQNVEDLLQPLDTVRNVKVQDQLPILFLDEFDTNPDINYPLLLPLLWDGELNIAHRNLKLGKLVVILAGSNADIQKEMSTAKSMQTTAPGKGGKLIDLLSRINGGQIEIPPLDLVEGERDRRADKVCLTISLLKSRLGTNLELVPMSLLRFVSLVKFKYGVRSLAHLIDLIEPFDLLEDEINLKVLTKAQLVLPLTNVKALRNSSLVYHVFSEDGPAAIVDHWSSVSSDKATARIKKEDFTEEELKVILKK